MHFLSINEMQHLRCKNCRNFLSYPRMVVWRDGTTLCGRCFSPKLKKFVPAYIFEHVIRTIRVPCRYWFRHCKELLYPDEVPLHEQVCIYKNRCEMLCGDLSAVFKMEKSLPHLKEPPKLLNLPSQALEWLLCTKCSLYLSAPNCYVNNEGRPFCFRCIATPLQVEYIRHADLEQLLSFMVFPCIFHLRGCTRRYRFGDPASYNHEKECAYGFAAQRPISQMKTINVNGKQKGVIPTHTGHVFATITPNTIQLFTNSGNWKDGQEKLLSNLHDKVGNRTITGDEDVQNELKPEQITEENFNAVSRVDEVGNSFREPEQILDVSKLEANPQTRARLDEVRNKFKEHAPPQLVLNQNRQPDDIDTSIMYRSKDSPRRSSMLYNAESIPISPVFVQQPHYNSLTREDSDLKQAFVVEEEEEEEPKNLAQTYTSDAPHRRSTPHHKMMLPMMADNEGPQSDEFQAYGLPYGNTNLTHGAQPHVLGKEVTLERTPSVLQYQNIVTELRFKQKLQEYE